MFYGGTTMTESLIQYRLPNTKWRVSRDKVWFSILNLKQTATTENGVDTWRHINTKNWHTRVHNVGDECRKLATCWTLETESEQCIHNHIIVLWDLTRWRQWVNEGQTHLDALCCQSMVQWLVRSLWIENTWIITLQTAHNQIQQIVTTDRLSAVKKLTLFWI